VGVAKADAKAAREAIRRGVVIAESQAWARDLVNTPALDLSPAELAKAAQAMARQVGLTCRVWSDAELKKGGFGGIVGVGQGSVRSPRMIELRYAGGKGAPIALTGKGIAFDSGGLSIKDASGMEWMKCDMGGAASILGAMRGDAKLLCLEIDDKLHGLLGRIEDPRLIAHLGCAGELREVLAAHGLAAPEVVISGIPFSTLERTLASRILEAIAALLAPGGRFIAYQVSASVERLCRPFLGSAHEELEPLNIPPVRLFRWTKRACAD